MVRIKKTPPDWPFDKPEEAEQRPLVLAVGGLSHWQKSSSVPQNGARVVLVEFSDLSETMLVEMNPDVVMSPHICTRFDCFELADMLTRIGFVGQYRVLVPDLPDPKMVLKEIRQLYPDLQVRIVHDASKAPGHRH